MEKDINHSPEPYDGISPEITYIFWCEKCCEYHGTDECPYDDYDYCPHCGQAMNKGGLG